MAFSDFGTAALLASIFLIMLALSWIHATRCCMEWRRKVCCGPCRPSPSLQRSPQGRRYLAARGRGRPTAWPSDSDSFNGPAEIHVISRYGMNAANAAGFSGANADQIAGTAWPAPPPSYEEALKLPAYEQPPKFEDV